MFTNIKNRLVSAIVPDISALPSTSTNEHQNAAHRFQLNHYQQRIVQQLQKQQHLQDKFVYSRPPFLQLLTSDELRASADHNVRPIIVPRDVTVMPWYSGYAECVNSGKSEWNEDQAAFHRQILSDPTGRYPDLPYTYFGIFDGHAGYGAALAASHQFHHILHEKLVDCLDLLLPRDNITENSKNTNSKNNHIHITHPSQFHHTVTKDELIIGALESAFFHMDSLIGRDRDRYRDAGGCTACVAVFINGKMYVANAGDSRAVLCKRSFSQMNDLDPFMKSSTAFEKTFAIPMSFDHTPETDKNRIYNVAVYKPQLMGKFYTTMEYARRPNEKDLGQRILCRHGTSKGWSYKTLTRDDLRMSVVTGDGKRARILGTLGVARGFGDHDLLAIASGMMIKPFLTSQPDVKVYDLTKIVTIPEEQNEDGDFGVLVMATDGLWDVTDNDVVSHTVFQTIDKYCLEVYRYTMAAQELVAKARGKINEYGHWRLSDSKAPATVDDISVIVIPVYQYYKEHADWEQQCLREYRERAARERDERERCKQEREKNAILVNGTTEMAQVIVVESPSSLGTEKLPSIPQETECIGGVAVENAIPAKDEDEIKSTAETIEVPLTKVEDKLKVVNIDDKDTEAAVTTPLSPPTLTGTTCKIGQEVTSTLEALKTTTATTSSTAENDNSEKAS